MVQRAGNSQRLISEAVIAQGHDHNRDQENHIDLAMISTIFFVDRQTKENFPFMMKNLVFASSAPYFVPSIIDLPV